MMKQKKSSMKRRNHRSKSASVVSTTTHIKSGRWTDAERRVFIKGLKRFGRGKWKEIATLIPTRSTIQVKTHAQMVMKRQEMGEDIFSEFDNEFISQQDERAAHILYQLRAVSVF